MKREITTLPKTAIIIDNSPKKFPLLHAKELLPSGRSSFVLCGFFDMKIVRGKAPFRGKIDKKKVPFRDDLLLIKVPFRDNISLKKVPFRDNFTFWEVPFRENKRLCSKRESAMRRTYGRSIQKKSVSKNA